MSFLKDLLKKLDTPQAVLPADTPSPLQAKLALLDKPRDFQVEGGNTSALAPSIERNLNPDASSMDGMAPVPNATPEAPPSTLQSKLARLDQPIEPNGAGVSYFASPLVGDPLENPPAAALLRQPQTVSEKLRERMRSIEDKDYSKAEYDSAGNFVKERGKDRDKKWSTWDKVGSTALGILKGFGSGGGLVGAAAGGIQAGTDRNYLEKQGDSRIMAKLRKEYGEAAEDEQFQNKQNVLKAQAATIPIDDANRKLQIENQRLNAIEQRKSTALGDIYKSKVHDKNNPAHRARAIQAGLDPDKMTSWDFSNPVTAKVNGQTWDYDRTTNSWNLSGLPESEKDKLVPLEISVPGETEIVNGQTVQKVRKFNVPQSQAASLSASLQAAGMSIQAARESREDNQAHTVEMKMIGDKLERAMKAYESDLAEAKAGRDEQRKLAAEQRAQERLKEIKQLEADLRGRVKKPSDF